MSNHRKLLDEFNEDSRKKVAERFAEIAARNLTPTELLLEAVRQSLLVELKDVQLAIYEEQLISNMRETDAILSTSRELVESAERIDEVATASIEELARMRDALNEAPSKIKRDMAKSAATAKNAPFNEGKAKVFAWLDAHLSEYAGRLDEAADAIEAAGLASVGWRQIRGYITEYRKSHSARTV
jgi:hypothetical protein